MASNIVRRAARAGAIGAGVGVAVFVAPPLLELQLPHVPFHSSLAATIQSAFYGGYVGAGSIFAIMQSIGATGTVVPAVVAAVGAGGAAAAAGGGAEDGEEGEGDGSDDGGDDPNGA